MIRKKEILKSGTVDFISFSYYMSNCISADPKVAPNQSGNMSFGVKNPYLKASAWGLANLIQKAYELP